MTTIYLIRHAQAEGNLYRRCHSWHNGLITAKGRTQIEALERRFEGVHFDAVYSSDLYRTMTTARAIYRSRNLPLRIDPGLREIGAGIWEDVPWGQLLHRHRDSLSAFLRCDPGWQVEGGETHPQVRRRVQASVKRIAHAHPGQTVAVVSHGCAIRAGLSAWLGMDEAEMGRIPLPDNTGVAKLEVADSHVQVIYYNDNHHLGAGAAPTRASGDYALAGMEKNALRFSPLPMPQGQEPYLAACRDGWLTGYGTMDGFDGASLLRGAEKCSAHAPDSLVLALLGHAPAGVLQMDWGKEPEPQVGRISFLYLTPEFRCKGLGIQLLGHAICTCRAMGRQYLQLCCPPGHEHLRQFCLSHGFSKVGEEAVGIRRLDIMETYIGLEL